MRVALLHNHYHYAGGEDRMVELEQALLESAGCRVDRFTVHNDDVFAQGKPWLAAKSALGAAWNRQSKRRVRAFLAKHRPDLSHVHNWFPLLSPSVYAAHQEMNVPVVQTLHNYRLGCAAATLRRDGHNCELCLGGDRSHAIRHACYRGSKLQSMVWRHTMDRNFSNGVFHHMVDAYIAPSRVVADKHRELGLAPNKLHVIPNACPDPLAREDRTGGGSCIEPPSIDSGRGGVFVGRLTEEKGVDLLLDAWRGIDAPLTVVGTGPEEARLRARAVDLKQVVFLGQVPADRVTQIIIDAAVVIFPSQWHEPFGLAVIEAMACGRPVIATDIGGPAEVVEDRRTGLLVPPHEPDALRQAIAALLQDSQTLTEMGRCARNQFLERYTPQVHQKMLANLFETVIQARRYKATA